MRGRRSRTLALLATAGMLVCSGTPALAEIPTTPIPEPADPGQAPITSPPNPQPLGHAIGDAGSALGVLRLLPNAVPTGAILPGVTEQLPKQAALEAGMGLSSAQANSEAYLAYERAIAESSPLGLSIFGNSPRTPGSLAQTALPDNPKPTTSGLNPPSSPMDPLLNLGLLNGSAHARYSETEGPCVGTISDASTELASVSMLNNLPALPTTALKDLKLPNGKKLSETAANSPAPLSTLGGLLSGGPESTTDENNSLISAPNALSSRSTVRLVDMPGTERKAVESTSTMQASSIELLKNSPLGLTVNVASQPTLRVTSTGNKDTSKVDYTAPVLEVKRGDQVLFTLDAAHPTQDIPIGLPLEGLANALGDASDALQDIPVVGGVANTISGGLKTLSGAAQNFTLDLGVLRLSIGQLDQKPMDMSDPFKGFQLGASARMLDLQVLPTKALKDLLGPAGKDLPPSLAQASLGEQVGRAYAPDGGVQCGHTTQSPPPGGGGHAPGVPKQLAQTSAAAYSTVPLFWTGAGLLLAGVVMVAAFPGRRRAARASSKPSPEPRE